MKNLMELDAIATDLTDATQAVLADIGDRYYAGDNSLIGEYEDAKAAYRAALEARAAIQKLAR